MLVSIWHSTNSRLSAHRSTFVEVDMISRSMDSSVIFVICSAVHSNIISDSLITSAKNVCVFFLHCWKSFSLSVNCLSCRDIMMTRTASVSLVFNWSVILTFNAMTSHWSWERIYYIVNDIQNRKSKETIEESKSSVNSVFPVLLLRQDDCTSFPWTSIRDVFSLSTSVERRHRSPKLFNPSSYSKRKSVNVTLTERYATMMSVYDYWT